MGKQSSVEIIVSLRYSNFSTPIMEENGREMMEKMKKMKENKKLISALETECGLMQGIDVVQL